jgi:hypothetical protein
MVALPTGISRDWYVSGSWEVYRSGSRPYPPPPRLPACRRSSPRGRARTLLIQRHHRYRYCCSPSSPRRSDVVNLNTAQRAMHERAGPPRLRSPPHLIPAIAWALTFGLARTRWSRRCRVRRGGSDRCCGGDDGPHWTTSASPWPAFMLPSVRSHSLLISILSACSFTVAPALVVGGAIARTNARRWRWPLVLWGNSVRVTAGVGFARSMGCPHIPAWTKKRVHDSGPTRTSR